MGNVITNSDPVTNRLGARQYNRFDCNVPAQYTAFYKNLVGQDARPPTSIGRQEGDSLRDSTSLADLTWIVDETIVQAQRVFRTRWNGSQDAIKLYDIVGNVIPRNRAVILAADNAVQLPINDYDPFIGITMNDSADLEGRCYVMTDGAWYVELDDEVAIAPQGLVSCRGTSGRAVVFAAAAATTRYYNGFVERQTVLINGLPCALVQVRQPVRTVTPGP